MSDIGLFLLAVGFGLTAVYLKWTDAEAERRDARRRNPERTWDDES